MERQKDLENKHNEPPTPATRKKLESASRLEVSGSKKLAEFNVPFRLELAGDRLSPLHEW